MKKRIYNLIDRGPHGNKWNLVVDYFIMTLIILSVVSIILESMLDINNKYSVYLEKFNYFTIVVFTIEYLLRLYVSDLSHPSNSRIKSAMRFVFSAYGLVDLLAILPFFLPMIIKIDLRFLRILRLTRFLRILKMNRYNDSLILIWTVVKEKRAELAMTGFLTFLILVIASFLMYYVEGETQSGAFPNVLEAFWWAIATLTTVGYEDTYPITGLGKLISGVISLLGIGIIALPTGIISAGFIGKLESKKRKKYKKCPHCGEKLAD
ncbi:MAG: ion transporter [Bacteroidetes bacterium]|nr:MAG: ion transporter [Bacteroidota bacterium]